LLENTANTSFLRQNLEERPSEELLAPPTMEKMKDEEDRIKPDSSSPSPLLSFRNAADTDYSIAEKRDRGLAAIQSVRQQLGQTYLPLINGERVNPSQLVDSLNPSNPSEIVGKIGLISIELTFCARQQT
jgi:RHH-type proline utilization regulon transcriptional repressor/proline dehydrogenase/delta 1-pyrroline-5-carboxylate dehydrogenase